MLIAAAARLEEPDILILDEPTNHLDLANINTLERWLTVEFQVPMLIVSHDREILDRVTERTLFLRSDGMHAFKTRFSLAREELLRRDATAAARAQARGEGDQAAGAGGGALQGLGGQEPRPQQAQERRRDAASPASRRTARRPTSRASGGWSSADGDIDAKVALRLAGLDGEDAGRPQADRHRPADHRRRRPHRPAGRQRRRQVDAAVGARRAPTIRSCEHYDGQAAVRFNPACRLVYFDQTHARPAARHGDPRLRPVGRGRHREGRRSACWPRRASPSRASREPIGVLSHGERARLVFLRMKLLRPNFYLLDEPTNHLDIEGQEDLEAQLEQLRRVLPVRQPRPLLHPHGGDALPRNPQGPAGRDRRSRRLLRRPELDEA